MSAGLDFNSLWCTPLIIPIASGDIWIFPCLRELSHVKSRCYNWWGEKCGPLQVFAMCQNIAWNPSLDKKHCYVKNVYESSSGPDPNQASVDQKSVSNSRCLLHFFFSSVAWEDLWGNRPVESMQTELLLYFHAIYILLPLRHTSSSCLFAKTHTRKWTSKQRAGRVNLK